MAKASFDKIFKVLVITFSVIFTIHVIVYVLDILYSPQIFIFRLSRNLFNMNREQSIPTLYNTIILLISALLLTYIALQAEIKRDKLLWSGMALIFLYIGVDDFTMIHEQLYLPFAIEWTGYGFLKYRWVIPFGIIILIIVFIYYRHIFRLPKKIRNKIILAGAVFVTGGFVLEMIGGYFNYNGYEILFRIAVTLEETGEMIGILIFIHALIDYIKLKNKIICIHL